MNVMKLEKEITDIDYIKTKKFFDNRSEKYTNENPYSVTMYQDNNKELVKERNKKELEKLLPFLKINDNSKVLDIACGIGRWADVLPDSIKEYCGIDFSKKLIDIANKRNKKENYYFFEGRADSIDEVLTQNKNKNKYNVSLIIGILMYLNDVDLDKTLNQIEKRSEQKSIICIREPIGIKSRLTLKDFYSDELNDQYNAIYRTREELLKFFDKTLLKNGFKIIDEGCLFSNNNLNNRKETEQYYFILER